MRQKVLEINHATMQFGGLVAVNDLTMYIDTQEIVALIGPNGAGKTTAFNMVTGVYKPTDGFIFLNKRDITGMRPDQITQLGIARTFQNIRLFRALSVMENVLIARHLRLKSSWPSAMLRLPFYRREEKLMREHAEELLNYMGLWEVRGEKASSLPYGMQRKLEMARALATEPSLLLLDEPAAGMNPAESEELTALIGDIRKTFKLTILLIEHHMDLVMDISDRIYVLDYGNLIAQGSPAEIQSNDVVIQAYLGVQEDDA
jgi:branched-chain amino acid transport system ATP-binding protein